jgi:uncharacterized tellurite resistance protein B-like protein
MRFAVALLAQSHTAPIMLPDTLHELSQSERYAYAKLLAFMTRVDDELTIDEMAVFEQRLGTTLLSPRHRQEIRTYLKNPPSLEECLSELGDESGRLALRDAALMSAADGNIDDAEYNVLIEIAAHLGLSESVVDDILEWVLRGYDWMQEGLDILNEG